MPLKEKRILVEGPDQETIVRTYYVNEKPPNPYDRYRNALQARNDKARRFVRRKVGPNEKGYIWRMGYNICAGTYSGGQRQCRWSGSSLNRNQNLRYDKKLEVPEGDSITLARKIAKVFHRRGEPIPQPLRHYLIQQDPESEGGFRNWLSTAQIVGDDGISLPIHMLSPRSRGKIRDKATAFFRSCPGHRVFCTLTFIAPVADGTGVAVLNKFLTTVRKGFPNLQYLWVAERQENTNIHFHIILNNRLPIRRYNALWVLQQYKAGLRGQTKYGEEIELPEIERRFRKGTIHEVFNPVDIKKVRSIAGLSAYLTKYITKQKETFFGCSPWHCSRGVSRLFTKTTVGPSAFAYMMGLGNCKVDKTTGEIFMPELARPKGRGGAYCILVYVNKKDAPLPYLREMEAINKWMIAGQVDDVKGYLDTVTQDGYRRNFCQPILN
jgi:hypothetical protein